MALLDLLRVIALLLAAYVTRCSGYVLDDSYSKKFRPNVEGPPTEVRIGVYIESLGAIKESSMDFRLTMYFREYWQDPRLAFNNTYERIYVAKSSEVFWSPDLFFQYEKSGHEHDLTVPNIVMKIQPDGSVFRSSRISLTSACYMDLHRFPFDSQRCSLNLMSYSYTTKDLILLIDDEDVEPDQELMMPSFVLKSIRTSTGYLQYSTEGNFSLAKVTFTFQRQMQSFMLTVYIPSLLLVTVAWLSFFIDAQAAPARVSLGITTVLTITTMTSGIQESLPVVTYAKAIDIWLAACLVFVFVALLEYALANYLLILNKKRLEAVESDRKQPTMTRDNPTIKPMISTDEQVTRYHTQYTVSPSTISVSDEETSKVIINWTADRVDCIARHIYPAFFIMFNIIYWPLYIWMTPAYIDD